MDQLRGVSGVRERKKFHNVDGRMMCMMDEGARVSCADAALRMYMGAMMEMQR